jgi:glycosyltransferase involved in cell wall biosynthesis
MLHWAIWGKRYRYIKSASTIPMCTLTPDELDTLKTRYLKGQHRLIVFFGFIYPHKGVDLLFDIGDPETDRIVIAGEFKSDAYRAALFSRASVRPWLGRADFLGFVQDKDVSALLAVADAVVLPFQLGGGDWNTSIHAATQTGSFVLTTSLSSSGYDVIQNVYFAEPGNLTEMKTALESHAGHRREVETTVHGWSNIAREHAALYAEVLS